ncbi:OsmC family protein [Undibacterium sp. CY18W]|uniref:OsmC family protein n=1 Tax=Undibacterium hunanense TaxID=2762292 RepID=A0ABR6ZSS6_9BURK|nr:OsmC family protein [Undibacterium hunanense]MBC3918931.1 OsmC family protein [Undibacterium hunanense]
MSDKTISAHVIETGESNFAVDIAVSGHHIKGDEPLDVEGGNLGPAPYDLLTAALGECTAMTVRWYARQHAWPLDRVEVNLTHHKEGVQDIFTKEVILHGAELTEEQRTRLIAIAGKCPVHKTITSSPTIITSAG